MFPYAVLYTIEVDYILLIAVMHCHREPGYWSRRTGKAGPARGAGQPATETADMPPVKNPPTTQ